MGDVCTRPPITIRFHDLHAGEIRRVMGKIASYHGGTSSFPSLVPLGYLSSWPFFGLPVCLMVLAIGVSYWIFGCPHFQECFFMIFNFGSTLARD